jgi:hypothetical protein
MSLARAAASSSQDRPMAARATVAPHRGRCAAAIRPDPGAARIFRAVREPHFRIVTGLPAQVLGASPKTTCRITGLDDASGPPSALRATSIVGRGKV